MATVNKDFKIKSGLIVEGTTGTINGNDILTKNTASDNYIIDLIGGETLITSVESTQLEVVDGELSVKSGVFDADGAAATALTDAQAYADALTTDDVAEGANKYYSDSLVDTHLSGGDGISYSAGTISADLGTGLGIAAGQIEVDKTTLDGWYDLSGSASSAQTAAQGYTDTALEDYTPSSSLDATVGGYGYLKSADLSSYATETYVNTAVDNLVDGAPGLLDTLNELAAAINDDENYATTMTTALAGKQATLTAGSNIDITADTISVTGLASTDISDFNTAALSATASAYDAAGSAFDAQQNAEAYTDAQLTNYTTTANLETTVDGYGFAYTSELPTSTDDLTEGSALYFTDSRAKQSAASLLTGASLTNITITGDESGLTITAENGVADSDTDDLAEGSQNLYFTDERAIDAVSNADIYPNAVIIDNVAKQVATSTLRATAGTHVAVAFAKADYRSAEFLVKVAYGDHTEISKVLLTLDVNDNISITEYGIVGTNGSGMTVSAGISGTDVQVLVTTANNNTTVTAVGTLLI